MMSHTAANYVMRLRYRLEFRSESGQLMDLPISGDDHGSACAWRAGCSTDRRRSLPGYYPQLESFWLAGHEGGDGQAVSFRSPDQLRHTHRVLLRDSEQFTQENSRSKFESGRLKFVGKSSWWLRARLGYCWTRCAHDRFSLTRAKGERL